MPLSLLPSSSIRPELRWVNPMMLRNVVVLPAPLRPTSPTMAPVSTVEAQSAQDGDRADRNRDAFDAEHAQSSPRTARRTSGRASTSATGPSAISFAAVKCDGPLRVALDDLHIVLNEDRGDTALLERRHQRIHDGKLVARTHAAGRLVHQQYLRLENDRQRHVEDLAPTFRQARHGPRCLVAQPEPRQDLIRP